MKVLLIFGWRDGPLDGVVWEPGTSTCWRFRLIAERPSAQELDDRLFALTELPFADSDALVRSFGHDGADPVWPVIGGAGSAEATRVVERLLAGGPERPDLIVRTTDFVTVEGSWPIAESRRM